MVPAAYSTTIGPRSIRKGGGIVRDGFLSSRMIGFILLALLALLYIAQSSQGATKEIKVQSLRSQIETIEQDNKQLELEAARAQALSTVEKSVPDAGLESVQSVEYLTPKQTFQPTP